jgi:hypothetical protein
MPPPVHHSARLQARASTNPQESSTLEFFEFATQGVRPLGALENASFRLSSSLDGKSVWYSELTEEQATSFSKQAWTKIPAL